MKKLTIAIVATISILFNVIVDAQPSVLTGSGSTNIYPLITLWSNNYHKVNPLFTINYSASGSGMGMKMLQNNAIHFAASEMPLSPSVLNRNKWLQFPIAISPVEVIYNLPKISGDTLVLEGSVIADIYMGKIKFWDNPAIKALNPQLTLPHHKIQVIYRSNESGTTYAFTHYLEQVSMQWAVKHDGNLLLDYLAKGSIGVNSNAALAKIVKVTPYSIGYCDYSYADFNHLSMASLVVHATKTSSGYLVRPGLLSAYAALVNSNDALSSENLTNLPGSNSWPILMATYILLPQNSSVDNGKVLSDNLHFFLWCLTRGAPYANDLKYIPVPWSKIEKIAAGWKQSIPGLDIDQLMSAVHRETNFGSQLS